MHLGQGSSFFLVILMNLSTWEGVTLPVCHMFVLVIWMQKKKSSKNPPKYFSLLLLGYPLLVLRMKSGSTRITQVCEFFYLLNGRFCLLLPTFTTLSIVYLFLLNQDELQSYIVIHDWVSGTMFQHQPFPQCPLSSNNISSFPPTLPSQIFLYHRPFIPLINILFSHQHHHHHR